MYITLYKCDYGDPGWRIGLDMSDNLQEHADFKKDLEDSNGLVDAKVFELKEVIEPRTSEQLQAELDDPKAPWNWKKDDTRE